MYIMHDFVVMTEYKCDVFNRLEAVSVALIREYLSCLFGWGPVCLNNDNNLVHNIVAYMHHARTVEPQKQPLLSNTRTQQWNNGVMQPASRQRLGKHTGAGAMTSRPKSA
jgi:hypothetical protein